MRVRLHPGAIAIVGLALALDVAALAAQVPTDTTARRDTAAVRDSAVMRDSVVARDTTPAVTPRFLPGPGVFAGSDQEDQVRTLQLLGVVPHHQWSLRALGPRELARFAIADTAAVPASLRRGWCSAACGRRHGGSLRGGVLPVDASLVFNSTHPFGMNDGPMWAGRGVTVAARAGVHGSVGPLSVILAPTVFVAQNQGFALEPNGATGRLVYAHQFFPGNIDVPQRFGDATLARLDPGESTVRLDLVGLAAGMSTASQWWGPMSAYPYLMSNNAGGFPHAFFGTARPANIGIGRLHGRVMYGELAQSDFSPAADTMRRRFASGLVLVFQPRGLEALEVGGGRFYHSRWPDGGITKADLKKPFEGLLKASTLGRNPDGSLRDDVHNQLASVFARLTLPASGVEIYGEFGREDHNADLRDFWLQPDYDAVYGLGLRRAWRSGQVASVFSTEFMNARISHISRARPQVTPYLHGLILQGHTQRGQPLGTAVATQAGEALLFTLRRYGARSASMYSLASHGEANLPEGSPRLVRLVGSAERSLQRGGLELTAGVSLSQRVGRTEQRGGTNLGVSLRSRWAPAADSR